MCRQYRQYVLETYKENYAFLDVPSIPDVTDVADVPFRVLDYARKNGQWKLKLLSKTMDSQWNKQQTLNTILNNLCVCL